MQKVTRKYLIAHKEHFKKTILLKFDFFSDIQKINNYFRSQNRNSYF